MPRRYLGKDVGVLHEINEQLDVVKPVTKWRKRVLEVAEIPAAVQEAFRQLKTGRPRPVHLEIPPDTLEEEGEAELLPPVTVARTAAPDADIERAARVLLDATRPIIYAGGGVHASGAHEALTAVAEYIQAGVVQSAEGKGSVSDQSDLALGAALWPKNPLRDYLDAADTIFVVGSRCAVAGFQPTPEDRPARRGRRGDRPQPSRGRSAWWATPASRSSACWSGCVPTRRPSPRASGSASSCARRWPGWTRRSRITRSWPRCAPARRRTPSSSPA